MNLPQPLVNCVQLLVCFFSKSLEDFGKVSKYEVFSGPYFPVFVLNTDIYSVNLRIQSKF